MDPLFLEDLVQKREANEPPVENKARVLLRRKRAEFLKIGFKRSLILHGVFVAFAGLTFLMSYIGLQVPNIFLDKKNITDELRKKSIRVDVVDLPTLKLSDLGKVDLTKSPKIVTKDKKPEAVKKPETVKKDQMVLEEKKQKESSAKQKALKAKALEEADELKRLQELQATLSESYLKDESLKSAQDNAGEGRELLAGNIKSQGYSATGDIATQKDAYQAEIRMHFSKFWSAPAWMKASGKYSAKILVRLAPDGRVLSQEFLERSGSTEYDELAAMAVGDASPFPMPPKDLVRNVMEDGIVCGFPE